VGAAIAVVAGTGGVALSGATNAQITPSQTLITPCRIMDTRSGPSNVGPRSTPLNGSETYSIPVTGLNGNCDIPAGTSGVVMNVTIVGPGSNGYLTVFPEGAPRPTASNLNFTAGQAPTPNQVTVALGDTGQVSFYASGGPVNVIADIAGFTTASRLTMGQLAQQRWDRDLARPSTVPVGTYPLGVAFDGTHVWVVNNGSGSVSRLDPATGAEFGPQITVGTNPYFMAYDGTSMWVTNATSNTVSQIDAASGAVVGSQIAVGSAPTGIAFDGTDVWVANSGANNLTRINATTGAIDGLPVTVGTNPFGMAFDGTLMWVTCGNEVFRVDVATGAVVDPPIPVTTASGIAFDGTDMWVANTSQRQVVRIRAATGIVVGSPVTVGTSPSSLAFDGSSVWVTNGGSNDVTRIDAATGTVLGTVPVGQGPWGIAFDGTNMWIANPSSDNVTKLRAN